MSFILDALRKSERERQQSLEGRLGNYAPTTGPGRARAPWALLAGLVLLVNAVVLLVLLWPRSPGMATGSAAETVHPAARRADRISPAPRGEIRPLAVEAAESARASPPSQPGASGPDANATPVIEHSAKEKTGPTLGSSAADVRPLEAMPEAFQSSLPKLHLDVHSYGETPASRFVVINMHRYKAGDVLDNGPRVVRVTPDGVILEFHGQPFLLPRP